MSQPEQLTVRANGLEIGVLAWGEPGAPLALLTHGYPDTAWTWRLLAPLLAAAGRRVVAPFSRGYGPTSLGQDGYRARVLAQDLLALHEVLGGDDRAVLIGHDWGAVATYAVAAAAPERFRRYVTLAVPPPIALLTPFTSVGTVGLGLRQLRNSWYFAFNQLPLAERSLERLVTRHWRDWSPGYDAREDIPRVLSALDTRERRTAALTYYRDNLRGGAVEGFRLRPAAPVLYLHGQDDGCVRADLAAHASLPVGSHFALVPGAGHFLQLEAPDAVHAQVQSWIGAA